MASRIANRVQKLEKMKSRGVDGIIIFFRNLVHKTVEMDGRKQQVMASGEFYLNEDDTKGSMSLGEMERYVAEGKYSAVTFFPVRDSEK